jgi:hypothetical protein
MSIERFDGADLDSLEAGADLSGQLFRFARIDTDGRLVRAGNGQNAYGVIREGSIAGNFTTVVVRRLVRVEAGAAITAGTEVMCDTDGRAIPATGAGNVILGVARGAASDAGVIFPVELDKSRVPA